MTTLLVVMAWVPVCLGIDRHVGYAGELVLAGFTWLLLLVLLRREDAATRAQVAVVVVFASLVEWGFSAGLHVYSYRLHESDFWLRVPQFVPPGHGLVYLAALTAGRQLRSRRWVPATLVVGAGYALWSLLLSGRHDVLGLMWFACLAYFLLRGRQPNVYVAAFLVVTWLELWGTGLGAWTWAAHSPTGVIPMGNPPADAAGGYGFFDAAALWLGPPLAAVAARWLRFPATVPAWVSRPTSGGPSRSATGSAAASWSPTTSRPPGPSRGSGVGVVRRWSASWRSSRAPGT